MPHYTWALLADHWGEFKRQLRKASKTVKKMIGRLCLQPIHPIHLLDLLSYLVIAGTMRVSTLLVPAGFQLVIWNAWQEQQLSSSRLLLFWTWVA